MTEQAIDILLWDSAHFGKRIARANRRQVDSNSCLNMLASCQKQAVDCLYFLTDASDQKTIGVLQANGFDLVDIRIALSCRISEMPAIGAPENIEFRFGDERDLEQLLPIAGSSFGHSRFYVDGRFGSSNASRMFQIWLQKSIANMSDAAVVLAEDHGVAVGFVSCHLRKPAGEGNIGLVGVAESARGLGCASGMIHYAARWFSQRGLERLNVVTQGRNVAGQRLYQRCGFVTRSVELWFHKWFN